VVAEGIKLGGQAPAGWLESARHLLFGDQPGVLDQMQKLSAMEAQGRRISSDPEARNLALDVAGNFNFAGPVKGKGGVISDWKWRPPAEVAAQLGPMAASPAVQGFGDFMLGQAQKAARGELTTRDVVKAYAITRGSIQRSAQSTTKLRENWPDFPGGAEKVRPEGAVAEWLLTPTGKQYLDAAEKGKVDLSAIGDAVTKLRGFGKENDLIDALTTAPTLKGSEQHVGEIIAASFQKPGSGNAAWRDWTKELRGIGPAKSGFVGSLLGKGDMPTLDARQVVLNTGRPTAEAQPYIARQGGAGGNAAVDRLAKRQIALGMKMSPELEPFRQHLTHHEVWDRVGNETTTHEDLIRAMRLASIGAGGIALGAASTGDSSQ
jgi:hypothetical protein